MSRSRLRFLPNNKQVAGMAIGAIAMLAMAVPAASQPTEGVGEEVFTLKKAIAVPGSPLVSFDISWVDPVLNGGTYFLADRSNKAIEVVDPTSLSIKQFVNPGFRGVDPRGNDFSGPDGVLTANDHKELWVGDSPGKVWVLDSTNPSTVLKLQGGAPNPILLKNPVTGKPQESRADELCYDPNDNLIMMASPAENTNDANPKLSAPYVSFISTKGPNAYTVVGQLVFDGKNAPQASNGLEQCGWSPKTGKFYQNVPEVSGGGDDSSPGAVAVIDPQSVLNGSPTVEKTLPVDFEACAGPQGMAIGPNNEILLGCSAPSSNGHRNTAIINTNSGAVLAVFPDLGGADEVWFNENDGHFFITSCNTDCRTSTTPQKGAELVGIIDSRGHRLDQSVVIANTTTTSTSGSQRRIHSVAADPNTNRVFVPIPAAGGAAPTWDPKICGSLPAIPNDKTGCIAVFATTNNDLSSVAQERAADAHQE